MIKVLKFGGTSVGDSANMRRVADIIRDEGANITVLSAMAGTTDLLQQVSYLACAGTSPTGIVDLIGELERKYRRCAEDLLKDYVAEAESKICNTLSLIGEEAHNYNGEISKRRIVAQGELLTTYIFTLYMLEQGCPVSLLNAPAFMHKNGEARVDAAALRREACELEKGIHYITQGFICSDECGRLDNLGRGGSDYSAALIGAAIGASEVQIWTDIDGMHNNDPRYVENTFPLRRMSFDEAEELAYFGSKILHPSTIQPCKVCNIPVLIKNTMDPDAPGTVISNEEDTERVYRAVAAKDNITVVRIYSARMLMAYGFLRKVFEIFERHRTPIDMITTSEVSVSLTVDSECRLGEIVAELEKLGSIEVESGNSIVCIVGKLDHSERSRAGTIMEAVGGVPLKMISYGASHRSIALLTETRYRTELLCNLNDKLFSGYVER